MFAVSPKARRCVALPTHSTQGPQLELPLDITPAQLQVLINSLLENVRVCCAPLHGSQARAVLNLTTPAHYNPHPQEEKCPYAFFLDEQEITASLMAAVQAAGSSVEVPTPF